MKMLLNVIFPHEPFNTLVREGKADSVMQNIMADIKPEAAYFTEQEGKRSVICVIEMSGPSDVPKFAEPFFLNFNADCRFQILMSPEDLQQAGLDNLGKKWA